MAANLKGRAIIAGTLGKRLANQISAGKIKDHPLPSSSTSRRVAQIQYSSTSSYYDKNVEDQVPPTVVPDYVINSNSDNKYWGPHPKTGVFGPAHDPNSSSSTAVGDHTGDASSTSSVLDQTVWFRPLEDVDKPPIA